MMRYRQRWPVLLPADVCLGDDLLDPLERQLEEAAASAAEDEAEPDGSAGRDNPLPMSRRFGAPIGRTSWSRSCLAS
jgi:hypothetical protein